MPHSQTVEAIVLKAYDVGEADRYCILFTKERGRVAVRARGVRKLTSRMGAALIPFRHITFELKETEAGFMAGSATVKSTYGVLDLAGFGAANRGFELLMRMLSEEEPLPDVFTASIAFLQACSEGVPHAELAYSLRLFHLLGLLPAESHILSFASLTGPEREYVHMAREGYFLRETDVKDAAKLERLLDRLIEGQLSTPLKAPGVVRAMQR